MPQTILIIKLGALGDFVLAFGPFASIRAARPGARIVLLTTRPFVELARASPWFDEIRVDARPAWWDVRGLLALRRALVGFDFIYDLQTSGRSSRYFWLAGRPGWSGIAAGASHPHANPRRDSMHTVERQAEQLAMAGVAAVVPDLSWLPRPGLVEGPYAVLVPGAAPHRPGKRWPVERFAALATALRARGLRPVVVGAAGDAPLAAAIGDAVDLTGRTSLLELGGVMAGATVAVGNDTGPMHMAAAVGCRCVVLFSGESDPALTAPRGNVTVIAERVLDRLPVEAVLTALTV